MQASVNNQWTITKNKPKILRMTTQDKGNLQGEGDQVIGRKEEE
jgi:hypothetical protein